MSELRHGIDEQAARDRVSSNGHGPANGGLPETVEPADVDLRADYLAVYPEEEPRERRRLFARSHADESRNERDEVSRGERRAQEKAAKARARENRNAAREAEKLAAVQAKEAEKRAAVEAREAEKLAAARAKEAESAAREAERRRAAEEKEAAEEASDAEKRAAARAREAEKAATVAERRRAAEAKEAEKRAAARAKEAEKEARNAEKLEVARAKEAGKLVKAQAKAAEKEAAEQEKLAQAEAKKAAKAAKAEVRKAPKAETKRAGNRFKRPRAPKPERGKSGKGVKKLVGLKIGASQIAAAWIENNGAPELVEAVREPLEPGLVASGEVRDPDALAASLKRFFDTHNLPKKGIRLGISNNRIGVRVFEIEGVTDENQLDNAIRFRAEEVLPIPLEEAVLDYVVLGEEQREDGTHVHRILLVVAYRDAVDRYLQACRGAGLEVVGVDLEAFALLRALSAPTDAFPGGGALIAVTVGHDRTTIAVSTGRYCDFTRVLDWGGWSLNVVIARALDMAPGEVEGIKRQLTLSEERPIEGLAPEQQAKVREAVRGALATFARELVASLQFYQAQPGALGIGEIQLTGGAAHLPGLPEELSRIIGVPVRVGDPLRRMMVSKSVGPIDQLGSFAVAIGLGIED